MQRLKPASENNGIMNPVCSDYEEWIKKRLPTSGEEDIPALGPSKKESLKTFEEVEDKNCTAKLKVDLVKAKESSGFKDIKNASKFWKVAQMMGTRKGLCGNSSTEKQPFCVLLHTT